MTFDSLMYFLILVVVILTAINIVRTIMEIMANSKRDAMRSKGMGDVPHRHSGGNFSLYGGSEGAYFGGSGCRNKHEGGKGYIKEYDGGSGCHNKHEGGKGYIKGYDGGGGCHNKHEGGKGYGKEYDGGGGCGSHNKHEGGKGYIKGYDGGGGCGGDHDLLSPTGGYGDEEIPDNLFMMNGGKGCHQKHKNGGGGKSYGKGHKGGYGCGGDHDLLSPTGGYGDEEIPDNLFMMKGGYGCDGIDLLSPTGGDIDSFYGGASTANLVLIKKNGNGHKVWIGQLKEHGNKLQCPGGFVQEGEDMEHCALRGASEMCGKDLVAAYYGKGLCKTSLYKDTPETKRGNVILIISKEEKYNKYDQNEELDASFSKDSSRLKWVPIKDILENDSISSDNGECVGIPFYLKRTMQEVSKTL